MLCEIGILILVDKDVPELFAVIVADILIILQQDICIEENIVEVHRVGRLAALAVHFEDAGSHGAASLPVLIAIVRGILFRGHHRILGIGNGGGDRGCLVQFVIEGKFPDYKLYKRFCIGGVINGESAFESDTVGMPAQHSEENGVESTHPEP